MVISKLFDRFEPSQLGFVAGTKRNLPKLSGVRLKTWPKTAAVADDYVAGWLEHARRVLASHKLCGETAGLIASHTSRRDGTMTMTDEALCSRSRRSLSSIERDISRLKRLGLIAVEVRWNERKNRRQRVVYLSVSEWDDPLNVSKRKMVGYPLNVGGER